MTFLLRLLRLIYRYLRYRLNPPQSWESIGAARMERSERYHVLALAAFDFQMAVQPRKQLLLAAAPKTRYRTPEWRTEHAYPVYTDPQAWSVNPPGKSYIVSDYRACQVRNCSSSYRQCNRCPSDQSGMCALVRGAVDGSIAPHTFTFVAGHMNPSAQNQP